MSRDETGTRRRLVVGFGEAFDDGARAKLKALVTEALEAAGGDVAIAAKVLGIPAEALTIMIEEDPVLSGAGSGYVPSTPHKK